MTLAALGLAALVLALIDLIRGRWLSLLSWAVVLLAFAVLFSAGVRFGIIK